MQAGIFLYAWDIADEGLDTILSWARDSGLSFLHPSSNYHAGWFLHPHNPRHKAFFAPDGALFFHPTPQFWQDCDYRPPVAPICAQTDWLRKLGERADDFGLQLTTWTICGHNTPFGLAHPEATVHNAWGDSYPHAPCLAHPLARGFHRSLVADLSHSLPLEGIQIESCRYEGWQHGHHHERDNLGLNEAECALMDLCFNPATVEAMCALDFDPRPLQFEARAILEAAFYAAPSRVVGHPTTRAQLNEALPDLARYNAARLRIEADCIGEMRAVMKPEVALYQMGGWTPQLDGIAQGFNIGTSKRAADAPAYVGFSQISLTSANFPDVSLLRESVQKAHDAEVDRLYFWNYSESPRRLLDEIKPALDGLVEVEGASQ